MSSPRFFQFPLPDAGQVTLDEQESRHASNVLRLQAGAAIVLFDGQGGEAEAVVASVHRRQLIVEIVRRIDTNRELRWPIDVLVALPKGDRQKTLVDGLVQLGASGLTPLLTERGVAQPTGPALARLERAVLESCKQCGRNHAMRISPPKTISELPAAEPSGLSLFAHPYGESLGLAALSASNSARIVIGGEGGLSDAEVVQLAELGWQQIGLGPRILRVEMAALKVVAWWSSRQS